MTVRAGIDQTTSSMRPEYSQSGQYDAFVLDARNQKAKAKIATMVGSTIASMIASESIRMVLSAAPIGPCGSRVFIAAPENGTAINGAADQRNGNAYRGVLRDRIRLLVLFAYLNFGNCWTEMRG